MNLNVNIGGLKLDNPVIAASGTFGFGREYSEIFDIGTLGAISVKGLTLLPRKGNDAPRIAETPAGMLNSVGLQNLGVHSFVKNEIPFLKKFNTKIIANVAGNTIEDYNKMAEILSEADIDAIEVNVSCPNVKQGCMAFGSTVEGISEVTKNVRKIYKGTMIVKLTPNVTDIAEIAKAAEAEGADSVSLINTLLGMVIDINTKRPVLYNNMGGLSGPAVRPIAVRMVHQVFKAVNIPVIGMGGVSNYRDAIEMILAGASAVMIGTSGFVNPHVWNETIEGIEGYLKKNKYKNINELVGNVALF